MGTWWEDEGDEVLARAMNTRLPTGSLSPDKEMSPEPGYNDATVRVGDGGLPLEDERGAAMPKGGPENCKPFC